MVSRDLRRIQNKKRTKAQHVAVDASVSNVLRDRQNEEKALRFKKAKDEHQKIATEEAKKFFIGQSVTDGKHFGTVTKIDLNTGAVAVRTRVRTITVNPLNLTPTK